MIIVRYKDGRSKKYGILEGETILEIAEKPYNRIKKTGVRKKLKNVKLLAPCEPSKILAIGINYKDHAAEMGHELPEEPVIFMKAPTAVIAHEDKIVYPPLSKRVDYESELAVVIKKKGKNIPREEAFNYVLGYTCLNDVTARDLQRKDGQWIRGKSFDTFCPIGPWIVTDIDISNLSIQAYLNGERRQNSNTKHLIFTVDDLIYRISQVMTLLPGDVITTGTSSGVGPMKPGDKVEIVVEKIGTLRNYVV